MTNSARLAQFAEPGQGLVFGQRALAADGAMGTMLQATDVSLAAGVDCITTNTFGANLGNLGEYGLAGRIGPGTKPQPGPALIAFHPEARYFSA
jgi:5-methyltetrahydrofolate--homocysteine methyltransferase